MAKLPIQRRIMREDLKDAPSWIERLIGFINPFFEDIYYAMNKQITFRENIDCDILEIEFETSPDYDPGVPNVDELQEEIDAINDDIDDLYNETDNLQDQITALAPNFVPVGTVLMWPSVTAPTNYANCDGGEELRTSPLFAIIGTTYGSGNGTTTFNRPNFQGLVPRSIGTASFSGRFKTGPAIGSTQEDQFQGHFHNYASSTSSSGGSNRRPVVVTNSSGTIAETVAAGQASVREPSIDNTPNGTPRVGEETRVSAFGINFIIKVS